MQPGIMLYLASRSRQRCVALSHPLRSVTVFTLAVLTSILGVSCSANSPQAASPASSKKTLQIAVIPWQSPAEQQKKLQPLDEYLEKQLGYAIEFQITKDYQSSVDLLADGKVDIAYLGGSTYLKAKQRNPQLEPIVAAIDRTTGRPWYSSVIVANTAKGIQSLKDLKGKRFAFVSPGSTSGYLVPMVHFKSLGIQPERDFVSVKYSGSHDKVQADLQAGLVDAIADDKPSFLRSQKAGILNAANYKIIWESDPIPTGPIVGSTQLPPQLILELKKALINAPIGLVDVSGTESAGYTLVTDADYDPLRQLQAKLKSQ